MLMLQLVSIAHCPMRRYVICRRPSICSVGRGWPQAVHQCFRGAALRATLWNEKAILTVL